VDISNSTKAAAAISSMDEAAEASIAARDIEEAGGTEDGDGERCQIVAQNSERDIPRGLLVV
jgi:hypothetical protein